MYILEGMSSISSLLHAYDSVINNRKIKEIWIDQSKLSKKHATVSFLKHEAKLKNFIIKYVSSNDISAHVSGKSHGGIIAFCTERSFPSMPSLSENKNNFYVLFDGIEDPFNLGDSIRSLYTSNVSGIILSTSYWMNETLSIVARSSAGTSELLPFFVNSDLLEICKDFKNNGFKVVCAGIRNSVSIKDLPQDIPILLVIGGEKRGISSSILSQADYIVRIDYSRPFNGSLSSASTVAILGYEISKTRSL